jgi:succinoglycan biosynthesis protein ExoM
MEPAPSGVILRTVKVAGFRDMAQPVRIDVGVCTFRRPQIADTLASLSAQVLPEHVTLRVVVADNEPEPAARERVEAAAVEHGLHLAYVHAPAQNISIARNAVLDALDGDYLAFIDDDQVAAPDWLASLLEEAERGGWDAVLGPVTALYEPGAPGWMAAGDFHSFRPVEVRGRILKGYSCNVLVRTDAIRRNGLRFDVAVGRMGGEDDAFFYGLTDAGGRIGFTDKARVFEPVPPGRANFKWLAKRSFRSGQSHGSRLLRLHASPARRAAQAAVAGAKGAACLAGAALSAPSAARRNRWLLRGALHAGAVARLAGVRELQLY